MYAHSNVWRATLRKCVMGHLLDVSVDLRLLRKTGVMKASGCTKDYVLNFRYGNALYPSLNTVMSEGRGSSCIMAANVSQQPRVSRHCFIFCVV